MKAKSKWVFWGFFSLDYQAMKTYLEEMAEKGWMLEKIGLQRHLAKFRAIEPQKLRFYVDVFKEGGPLTPENTEESERYRSLCEESGWKFITSADYLQFFYADEDSDPVPIQTDQVLEQELVEHTLLRNELRGFFLVSLILAFLIFRSLPIKYHILLSFTGVAGIFLLPMVYILTTIPAAYSIFRTLKARRNIKRGLPLEMPTMKSARRRIVLFSGSILFVTVVFLMFMMVDVLYAPQLAVRVFLGPGIGIIIGASLRYYTKKKAKRVEDSIPAIMFAVVALIIFVNTAVPYALGRVEDSYIVDSIPEGYPVVTIDEISKGAFRASSTTMDFRPGSSPVVPRHYSYREYASVNGHNKGLNVKYYKTTDPYYADIVFTGIGRELEEGIRWQGMTIFDRTLISDEEMKNLWGVEDLVLTQERDMMVIRDGGVVLRLSGDMDFRDIKTRELIMKRFFADHPREKQKM